MQASLHGNLVDRCGPACYSAHQAPPRYYKNLYALKAFVEQMNIFVLPVHVRLARLGCNNKLLHFFSGGGAQEKILAKFAGCVYFNTPCSLQLQLSYMSTDRPCIILCMSLLPRVILLSKVLAAEPTEPSGGSRFFSLFSDTKAFYSRNNYALMPGSDCIDFLARGWVKV